jgi:hypothetical protein
MRHRILGMVIVVVGALLGWLAIRISFDPLIVVGSTAPATILGPAVGQGWVGLSALLLLALAGWMGRNWRVGLLLSWLLLLAIATHRVVERADGRVADVWLGVTVQSLAGLGGEDAVRRCRAEGWLVRCTLANGRRLITLAPFSFEPLSPGEWDREASLQGGKRVG